MESTKILQYIHAPRGIFQGRNFMTPKVFGYFKLYNGYAELSEGIGIEGERIFGVTVRNEIGIDSEKRSKLFHSKSIALEYIRELS